MNHLEEAAPQREEDGDVPFLPAVPLAHALHDFAQNAVDDQRAVLQCGKRVIQLDIGLLIALTCFDDLRKPMLVALQSHSVSTVSITLSFIQEHFALLGDNVPAMIQESLGQALSQIKSLRTLDCCLRNATSLPFIISILHHCKQITTLSLIIKGPGVDQDELSPLCQAIREHSAIQKVCVQVYGKKALKKISQALSTIPKLYSCNLNGGYSSSVLLPEQMDIGNDNNQEASSDETATQQQQQQQEIACEIIVHLVSNPSLRELTLETCVSCENPEVMQIMCRAIASSKIVKLSVNRSSEILLNGLGQSVNGSKTLKTVSLGSPTSYLDAAKLTAFLQHRPPKKLHSLDLFLINWSTELDQALANFVKGHASIESLHIHVPDDYSGAVISSDALLVALDSYPRCLSDIYCHASSIANSHICFDSKWCEQLQSLAKLNHWRKTHGRRLTQRLQQQDHRRCLRRNSRINNTPINVATTIRTIPLNILFQLQRRGEYELLQNLTRLFVEN